MLGISERASEDEILSAYAHKINEIDQNKDVNLNILEKKRQELSAAKEECLSWKEKTFPSRISSRLSEFSANVSSPNRLNECCIGPFSCCDLLCGEMCCGNVGSHEKGFCNACCFNDTLSYAPSIWCDIILYAGIGIAVLSGHLKAKAELEQKQSEERAAAERERAARLQSSEQECRSSLKNMLLTVNAESAQNVMKYIAGKPESVPKRDTVNREFAINEAKQYISSIDNACMKAILEHRFEDATQYLKLLSILNPRENKYQKLISSINSVMKFLHAQTPYIITAEYAEIKTTIVNEIKAIHAKSSLSIESHELQELVWGLALEKPFDIYSYRTLAINLSGLGKSVDVMATLIYVDSQYGRSVAERVLPSYYNDLRSFISSSSPSTILSLASVSAWCGNSVIECLALGELNKKQPLSGKLKERYDLIKIQ